MNNAFRTTYWNRLIRNITTASYKQNTKKTFVKCVENGSDPGWKEGNSHRISNWASIWGCMKKDHGIQKGPDGKMGEAKEKIHLRDMWRDLRTSEKSRSLSHEHYENFCIIIDKTDLHYSKMTWLLLGKQIAGSGRSMQKPIAWGRGARQDGKSCRVKIF